MRSSFCSQGSSLSSLRLLPLPVPLSRLEGCVWEAEVADQTVLPHVDDESVLTVELLHKDDSVVLPVDEAEDDGDGDGEKCWCVDRSGMEAAAAAASSRRCISSSRCLTSNSSCSTSRAGGG